MKAEPKCPKCGGGMESGFIADMSYGQCFAARWVQGPPRPAFLGGVKLRGSAQYGIESFRCSNCGFLESYATKPPA